MTEDPRTYGQHAAPLSKEEVAADAKDRALRTFLQGLLIDVAVAVCLVLVTALSATEVDWWALLILLGKTALTAAASYVMRKFGKAPPVTG